MSSPTTPSWTSPTGNNVPRPQTSDAETVPSICRGYDAKELTTPLNSPSNCTPLSSSFPPAPALQSRSPNNEGCHALSCEASTTTARETKPSHSTPHSTQHIAHQDKMSSLDRPASAYPSATTSASTATTTTTPEPKPPVNTEIHYAAADPTAPSLQLTNPPTRQSTPLNVTTLPLSSADVSPARSEMESDDDEKRSGSDADSDGGSKSEIQSIMEQFNGEGGGPGADEVMSPRLEIASPMLGSPIHHPPRRLSLDISGSRVVPRFSSSDGSGQPESSASPLPMGLGFSSAVENGTHDENEDDDDDKPPVPPKDASTAQPASFDVRQAESQAPVEAQTSAPSLPLHRPPPPEPEPEPALPFDFHRFLEQLRNKKADPIARYLRSFLSEFGKRRWMVHEQVKIIGDFLTFIANRMAVCEVWRDMSDAEFDNAREGMEKMVMNRLYTQTFSPAIPPPQPIPGARPKRRGGERPMGPGRRGQHQEDVERDEILAQKINIYRWVNEAHLDMPAVSESGQRFVKLARSELLKLNSYRAPRDKIICVLNCCKAIFGLFKHSKSDASADSFIPMLIYVVLRANPEHLVSNLQYILRFRNQEKLGGEAGYYLSSLMGAVQFIENMDRTSLTISDEEFEKNVEESVSAIAERHDTDAALPNTERPLPAATTLPPSGDGPTTAPAARLSTSPRPSLDHDAPMRTSSLRLPRSLNDGRDAGGDVSGSEEREAPISGLLRTIQRPLSTIGRIFSDDPSPVSPLSSHSSHDPSSSSHLRPTAAIAEETARQASADVAEAQRIQRVEHANVVNTLAGMFPDLDKDVISDVVHQKEGRVGLAVDACLALSA